MRSTTNLWRFAVWAWYLEMLLNFGVSLSEDFSNFQLYYIVAIDWWLCYNCSHLQNEYALVAEVENGQRKAWGF